MSLQDSKLRHHAFIVAVHIQPCVALPFSKFHPPVLVHSIHLLSLFDGTWCCQPLRAPPQRPLADAPFSPNVSLPAPVLPLLSRALLFFSWEQPLMCALRVLVVRSHFQRVSSGACWRKWSRRRWSSLSPFFFLSLPSTPLEASVPPPSNEIVILFFSAHSRATRDAAPSLQRVPRAWPAWHHARTEQ